MQPIGGVKSESKSAWRYFPWITALAMGLVVAVNAGMMWSAFTTFPGAAQSDGFDLSNEYDRILAAKEKQNEAGWQVNAIAEQGLPVVRLSKISGGLVEGAQVEATAVRPVGPVNRSEIVFRQSGDGRYLGAEPLPLHGQWDLMLRVSLGGHKMRVTRRIVVP